MFPPIENVNLAVLFILCSKGYVEILVEILEKDTRLGTPLKLAT